MKKINTYIFIFAIALSACGRKPPAALGADAPAGNVPNIVGSYALNAIDPTGEQYGGTSPSLTVNSQTNTNFNGWSRAASTRGRASLKEIN